MIFAQEFSQRRRALQLSQEEIANSIGVSRSYITLIEKGQRLPGKKILFKIAETLGVKKHFVINWYLKDIHARLK